MFDSGKTRQYAHPQGSRQAANRYNKTSEPLSKAFWEIATMKNLIYAGVIVVCLVAAVLVFVKTRGSSSPLDKVPDSELIWVKCVKCDQGYQMSLKQFLKEGSEKSAASTTGIPVAPLLTCRKCGKDGIVKACKCTKCGEVFREGSVGGDLPDRCPKCKYSETEAIRAARRKQQQ